MIAKGLKWQKYDRDCGVLIMGTTTHVHRRMRSESSSAQQDDHEYISHLMHLRTSNLEERQHNYHGMVCTIYLYL